MQCISSWNSYNFAWEQIGVGFDTAVVGGISLNGACPAGHGFFCSARQLASERRAENASAERHAVSAAADALFDFVNDVSRSAPLIVFLKVNFPFGAAPARHL